MDKTFLLLFAAFVTSTSGQTFWDSIGEGQTSSPNGGTTTPTADPLTTTPGSTTMMEAQTEPMPVANQVSKKKGLASKKPRNVIEKQQGDTFSYQDYKMNSNVNTPLVGQGLEQEQKPLVSEPISLYIDQTDFHGQQTANSIFESAVQNAFNPQNENMANAYEPTFMELANPNYFAAALPDHSNNVQIESEIGSQNSAGQGQKTGNIIDVMPLDTNLPTNDQVSGPNEASSTSHTSGTRSGSDIGNTKSEGKSTEMQGEAITTSQNGNRGTISRRVRIISGKSVIESSGQNTVDSERSSASNDQIKEIGTKGNIGQLNVDNNEPSALNLQTDGTGTLKTAEQNHINTEMSEPILISNQQLDTNIKYVQSGKPGSKVVTSLKVSPPINDLLTSGPNTEQQIAEVQTLVKTSAGVPSKKGSVKIKQFAYNSGASVSGLDTKSEPSLPLREGVVGAGSLTDGDIAQSNTLNVIDINTQDKQHSIQSVDTHQTDIVTGDQMDPLTVQDLAPSFDVQQTVPDVVPSIDLNSKDAQGPVADSIPSVDMHLTDPLSGTDLIPGADKQQKDQTLSVVDKQPSYETVSDVSGAPEGLVVSLDHFQQEEARTPIDQGKPDISPEVPVQSPLTETAVKTTSVEVNKSSSALDKKAQDTLDTVPQPEITPAESLTPKEELPGLFIPMETFNLASDVAKKDGAIDTNNLGTVDAVQSQHTQLDHKNAATQQGPIIPDTKTSIETAVDSQASANNNIPEFVPISSQIDASMQELHLSEQSNTLQVDTGVPVQTVDTPSDTILKPNETPVVQNSAPSEALVVPLQPLVSDPSSPNVIVNDPVVVETPNAVDIDRTVLTIQESLLKHDKSSPVIDSQQLGESNMPVKQGIPENVNNIPSATLLDKIGTPPVQLTDSQAQSKQVDQSQQVLTDQKSNVNERSSLVSHTSDTMKAAEGPDKNVLQDKISDAVVGQEIVDSQMGITSDLLTNQQLENTLVFESPGAAKVQDTIEPSRSKDKVSPIQPSETKEQMSLVYDTGSSLPESKDVKTPSSEVIIPQDQQTLLSESVQQQPEQSVSPVQDNKIQVQETIIKEMPSAQEQATLIHDLPPSQDKENVINEQLQIVVKEPSPIQMETAIMQTSEQHMQTMNQDTSQIHDISQPVLLPESPIIEPAAKDSTVPEVTQLLDQTQDFTSPMVEKIPLQKEDLSVQSVDQSSATDKTQKSPEGIAVHAKGIADTVTPDVDPLTHGQPDVQVVETNAQLVKSNDIPLPSGQIESQAADTGVVVLGDVVKDAAVVDTLLPGQIPDTHVVMVEDVRKQMFGVHPSATGQHDGQAADTSVPSDRDKTKQASMSDSLAPEQIDSQPIDTRTPLVEEVVRDTVPVFDSSLPGQIEIQVTDTKPIIVETVRTQTPDLDPSASGQPVRKVVDTSAPLVDAMKHGLGSLTPGVLGSRIVPSDLKKLTDVDPLSQDAINVANAKSDKIKPKPPTYSMDKDRKHFEKVVVEGTEIFGKPHGKPFRYTENDLKALGQKPVGKGKMKGRGQEVKTTMLQDVLRGKPERKSQKAKSSRGLNAVSRDTTVDGQSSVGDLKAEFQDLGMPDSPVKDMETRREPGRAEGSVSQPEPQTINRAVKEAVAPEVPSGPPLESLCEYSSYIDGIGYAEYPGRCEKVVQCYNYRGRDIAVLRDCPYGYFWHQEQALCRPPAEVPCYDDPCLDIDVIMYNRSSGCRSHYACEYGISIPQCCDKGFRYVGSSCIPDPTCYDPCSTPLDIERQMRFQSCKFLPDEYNPYGYLSMEHNGLRIRKCPSGTVYSARQCGCRTMNGGRSQPRRRMQQCKPEFSMDFQRTLKDVSGSNMAVDVSKNVRLVDGAAYFDGNAKITVWGYMNKEFGKKFAIKLRFKPEATATEIGTLISNCGMTGSPTVSIDIQNHQLVSTAKSQSFMKAKKIKDHFDPYNWNDVVYMYDGTNFAVTTNGFRQKISIGGLLETRSNAIVIGSCPNRKGYVGLIDSIEIYSGCIPRDIIAPKRKHR